MNDKHFNISFKKTDHYWIATCDGFTIHINHDYTFFDAATLCMDFKKTFKVYTSSNAFKELNTLPYHSANYNVNYLPDMVLW